MEKIYWKNDAKCAVMLTFDLDGDTTWSNGNEGYKNGVQPDIEFWYSLYRIGRSRRSRSASFGGGVGGILPWLY